MPNDPKLSDGGGWRAGCMVGGKAAVEAASVTAGAVRCSEWLGVAVIWVFTLILSPCVTKTEIENDAKDGNEKYELAVEVGRKPVQNLEGGVEAPSGVEEDGNHEQPKTGDEQKDEPPLTNATNALPSLVHACFSPVVSGLKILEELGLHSYETVATPNDPKLSDCGARRAGCMVGARRWSEAASVTRGAVRCSAWLGDG